jgi:hypothetical protein
LGERRPKNVRTEENRGGNEPRDEGRAAHV